VFPAGQLFSEERVVKKKKKKKKKNLYSSSSILNLIKHAGLLEAELRRAGVREKKRKRERKKVILSVTRW
jgi:hypothetical protein